jgi:hypothetical protein
VVAVAVAVALLFLPVVLVLQGILGSPEVQDLELVLETREQQVLMDQMVLKELQEMPIQVVQEAQQMLRILHQ